tara:strand:+ start:13 stop:507 length:495 start_codon:yes stop_codon:yes gene_type:complete
MNKILEKLKKIHHLCIDHKLTISTAESCTGGYVSKCLTDQAKSSQYYKGSIIAYSNEVKCDLLDVPDNIIAKYGAVSEETCLLMARGVFKIIKSDIAISVTGIMEKNNDPLEKTTQVFIAIKSLSCEKCFHFILDQDRESNREKTIYHVFSCLYDFINKNYLLS